MIKDNVSKRMKLMIEIKQCVETGTLNKMGPTTKDNVSKRMQFRMAIEKCVETKRLKQDDVDPQTH